MDLCKTFSRFNMASSSFLKKMKKNMASATSSYLRLR
ncbi:unnamed protein product [Brassica oleracea]